jgi:hypothetical protein
MSCVHALSGPRNVSTALMYSFAQRPGWSVVDEPFYAAYLARTGADHPGREAVLASQPNDLAEVWAQLEAHPEPVYLKNMAHHMDGVDLAPAAGWKHILWIRSPRKVIASFAKVVPDVQLRDVALLEQLDALGQLQSLGSQYVVVDSDQVLRDPERGFRALCAALDLEFRPEQLKWPAGPKPYDGVWAPHWYAQVHQSTGFGPASPEPPRMADRLEALAEEVAPLYARLANQAHPID